MISGPLLDGSLALTIPNPIFRAVIGFVVAKLLGDRQDTRPWQKWATLPLFLFNQFGDLERCVLCPGNVHSADGWRDVLEPVVARYKDKDLRRYFRGDAAFASPEVYDYLEVEGIL